MASMETPVQSILDESIEKANRSLGSQELLNQAQDILVENEHVDEAAVPITKVTMLAGVLTNKTKGNLSVMAHYTYAGHTVIDYPNPLKLAGPFAMVAGLFGKGVMAAVVYSGENKLGIECGWLLAFADTEDTGRKVTTQRNHRQPSVPNHWCIIFLENTASQERNCGIDSREARKVEEMTTGITEKSIERKHTIIQSVR
jgi:hypothetical protein